MVEVTAVAKHSCAACGAQAVWNPAKSALVCSYCGSEAPAELDAANGVIREIPLVETLRELPESMRGWQAEKRTVRCRSCQATSVFDPQHVGRRCDFCGSPELVDYEEIKAPIRPQSLLPFKVDEARVRESIRGWYRSKWLAPGKLKRRALVDTVHGVYLPYWTFDSQVHCPWRADSGTYYYENETYRDKDGNRQTRQVRHVRWRPASGAIDHFFDDEPVPGSHGVDGGLLRAVEPFPTDELVAYDTAYVSGFVIEHYQVVLFDAAASAEDAMHAKLRSLCAQQVPGDTQRNLQIEPKHRDRTFKHILVPVWLLTYDYGRKTFQVVVNGYSGEMAGEYPKSPWKILALVLLALIVVVLFIAFGGSR